MAKNKKSKSKKAKGRRSMNPIGMIRKLNPFRGNPAASTIFGAVALAAVGIAGGLGIRKIVRSRKEKKALTDAKLDLSSYLDMGATLADSPDVLSDIMQPILLRSTPEPPATPLVFDYVNRLDVSSPNIPTRPDLLILGAKFSVGGQGLANSSDSMIGAANEGLTTFQSSTVADGKAAGALVLNVSGETARQISEDALYRVANGTRWNDEVERTAAIYKILAGLAPEVDWKSTKPLTAAADDPVAILWDAVDLLGTVAAQSYWNKKALNVPVPQPIQMRR